MRLTTCYDSNPKNNDNNHEYHIKNWSNRNVEQLPSLQPEKVHKVRQLFRSKMNSTNFPHFRLSSMRERQFSRHQQREFSRVQEPTNNPEIWGCLVPQQSSNLVRKQMILATGPKKLLTSVSQRQVKEQTKSKHLLINYLKRKQRRILKQPSLISSNDLAQKFQDNSCQKQKFSNFKKYSQRNLSLTTVYDSSGDNDYLVRKMPAPTKQQSNNKYRWRLSSNRKNQSLLVQVQKEKEKRKTVFLDE